MDQLFGGNDFYSVVGKPLYDWLVTAGVPGWLVAVLYPVVGAVASLGFITAFAILAIWGERRFIARLQDRRGPNRVGKFGLLQTVADVVKLLLDKGADVHAKAEDGSTALMWAAVTGHFDLAKLLKGHGAELALPTAAMLGDLAEVQRLVGAGADVNEQDSDGWTPLMYAAQKGRLEVAKLLLEKGADPITRRKDGSTAFMDAIGSAQIDTIRLLLDKGADTRAERRIPIGKTDFLKMTPLEHATMYEQPEVVKLIKTHATGE